MLVRGVHSLVCIAALLSPSALAGHCRPKKHSSLGDGSYTSPNVGYSHPIWSATIPAGSPSNSKSLKTTFSTKASEKPSESKATSVATSSGHLVPSGPTASGSGPSKPASSASSPSGSAPSKPASSGPSALQSSSTSSKPISSPSAVAPPASSSASSTKTSSSVSTSPSGGPVLTPDNTCGGTNGYTCDPAKALGGSCCSSSGFCGE